MLRSCNVKSRPLQVIQIPNISRDTKPLSLDFYAIRSEPRPYLISIIEIYSTDILWNTFIFWCMFISVVRFTVRHTVTEKYRVLILALIIFINDGSHCIAHFIPLQHSALTDLTTWWWAHQTRCSIFMTKIQEGLVCKLRGGHLDPALLPVHTWWLKVACFLLRLMSLKLAGMLRN